MQGGLTVQSVVVDANVCITLIGANELQILKNIEAMQFYVPDEVVQEVVRPLQRQVLQHAIEEGILDQISITDQAELLLFADIRDNRRLGAGESACIAIAQTRGWSVATDELRRCRAEIIERLGAARLLTTENLRQLANN